jgi:hypothetical protein
MHDLTICIITVKSIHIKNSVLAFLAGNRTIQIGIYSVRKTHLDQNFTFINPITDEVYFVLIFFQ